MSFMSQVVFYLGMVDAVLIIAFGLVVAMLFLLAKKEALDTLMDRAFPALAIVIGSSVAAAIVLAAIRWLLGMGA